jgi:hypothetical protein
MAASNFATDPHPWLGLKRALAASVALALGLVACGAAEERPPLALERTIALPGVSGRIDHLAVDLKRGRLFVAEVGGGGLDQIDLATGARLHRVAGLKEPQGVAYLPALDQVVVANGGDGTVRFYAADDLAPAGVVQAEGDADNVRILESAGQVVVADGKGLALIDPQRRSIVGRVDLGAHPEGFQIDQASGRAYVNMPSQRRIAAVDLAARHPVASWPSGLLFANYPLALSGGTVAAVFRAPPRLLVLDAASGRTLTNIGTCGDSDDAHFDPRRRRLYVTCGAGMVEAFAQDGPGYRAIGRAATRPGARTALYVPELDRLFVAARADRNADAAILVLRPRD